MKHHETPTDPIKEASYTYHVIAAVTCRGHPVKKKAPPAKRDPIFGGNDPIVIQG